MIDELKGLLKIQFSGFVVKLRENLHFCFDLATLTYVFPYISMLFTNTFRLDLSKGINNDEFCYSHNQNKMGGPRGKKMRLSCKLLVFSSCTHIFFKSIK